MSIIDMKLTEEEIKKQHQPSVLEDAPKYPYGLHLELNPEVVKKLGISDPPQVGDELVIMARVKVDNVGIRHGLDDQQNINIGLQITGLGFEDKEGEEKQESKMSANKFYSDEG